MAYQNFHITNKALIFHNNRFLLIKSSDEERPDDYECPGGRTDKGEKVFDVIKREVKEEIGLDLDVIGVKADFFTINQRDQHDYGFDEETHILEIYYKINLPDDFKFPEIKLAEEHKGFIWIDKNTDLNKLSFRNNEQKEIFKLAQSLLQ